MLVLVSGLGLSCSLCRLDSSAVTCEHTIDCPVGYRCHPDLGICIVDETPTADAAAGDAAAGDSAAADGGGLDRWQSDRWASDRETRDRWASDQMGDGGQNRDVAAGIDAALTDRESPDSSRADVAIGDAATSCPVTVTIGSFQQVASGVRKHFPESWDLTRGDLILAFTYDATGIIDEPQGVRTWAELGVRQSGGEDFNPAEGTGVWMVASIDQTAGTLDPDPVNQPNQDMDDILALQRRGGYDVEDYNLPSSPPVPGDNHRIWFDRDGVDQNQAHYPVNVDGGTYNTGGIYDVVIALHATGATTGTAYMTVNGLAQGFETDGNWSTIELTPAGMIWSGDMTRMQIFYSLGCSGVASSVAFTSLTVTGCLAE
ncbi:MAG: hypothetical protein JXR83_23455 [Deltaproteobacteria bacterium]|nr:hypothetical protein [Deltaproteobacteria bacterium]